MQIVRKLAQSFTDEAKSLFAFRKSSLPSLSLNLLPNGLFLLHPKCGEAAFVYFLIFLLFMLRLWLFKMVFLSLELSSLELELLLLELVSSELLLKYRIPRFCECCDQQSQCVSKNTFLELQLQHFDDSFKHCSFTKLTLSEKQVDFSLNT